MSLLVAELTQLAQQLQQLLLQRRRRRRRQMNAANGDVPETAFLFHRVPVAIQRFYSLLIILVYESFAAFTLELDL